MKEPQCKTFQVPMLNQLVQPKIQHCKKGALLETIIIILLSTRYNALMSSYKVIVKCYYLLNENSYPSLTTTHLPISMPQCLDLH